VDISELPRHDEVAAEIASLQLGLDAAELHGSLCGFLSGGGDAQRRDWLAQLALDADGADIVDGGALDRLFDVSQLQLGDPDLGFALLLPDDDSAVIDRAEGLLAWCRGFLGGFGLASGSNPPLSPEAREALEDMAKIAASALSYEEPEADEAALVEVAEFVRVAALLLHDDCNRAPPAPRQLH
jgi:uncharacterized protein